MMVGLLAGMTQLARFINLAAPMIEAAAKLADTARGRSRSQPTENLKEFHQRLITLEGNLETQTELMAELTQHHAVLLRWLIILTLALVVMGGVAIAGLVMTLLR